MRVGRAANRVQKDVTDWRRLSDLPIECLTGGASKFFFFLSPPFLSYPSSDPLLPPSPPTLLPGIGHRETPHATPVKLRLVRMRPKTFIDYKGCVIHQANAKFGKLHKLSCNCNARSVARKVLVLVSAAVYLCLAS